jgi:serine/threonine-protein kinase
MALAAGTRLGPYTISAPLGAGGMGEVYTATDTRLDRTVAIKVLPEHVASDPELKQRFEREAKTLAALSHPHICPIHDIGSQNGIDFLVMEYLEGETLEQRLKKGALPLDQALQLGIQIADALATAHRAGIVHRDLKPGNIMLTKSGARLLDFGLAKTGAPAVAGSLTMLPTTPPNLTAQGAILGTFQYMAPEQLEGNEADVRTDIFAFGVVVYEMVTGRKAFDARSHASLIAAILEHEPTALSVVRPAVPRQLEHIVRRCLAKSPDDRWQTAADLKRELAWVAESMAVRPMDADQRARPRSLWRRPISLAASVVASAVVSSLAGVAVWTLSRGAPPVTPRVARLTVTLPAGQTLGSLQNPSVAISPNGAIVAYVAVTGGREQLHLRAVDTTESRVVPGTDLARNPFFSPDGGSIGFFAEGKLKKVSIAASTVQIVCDVPDARGGSWGADGNIYFASSPASGLFRVRAEGGVPVPVTRLDRAKGEVSHRWPQLLRGGRALMFTVWTGPARDERNLHVQRLDTGERTLVAQGGDTGRFVQTGHVVYARADELFMVPFSLDLLEVVGQPVRLDDAVRGMNEGAHFAVADTGDLVYLPGNPQRYDRRLVWVDRDGRVAPLAGPSRQYYGNVAISPDGGRAAVDIEAGTYGLWIYDFSRATLTPLTTGSGSSQAPRWTSDGTRIVYRGTRNGFRNLWRKVVDEAAGEERLSTGDNMQTPSSLSNDGRWLIYHENNPATAQDIWALPVAVGDRTPRAVVRTPFTEQSPQLSPDGRWLAYTSNESGRVEVFVQPFPDPGARIQISTEGGEEPVWSRNGRELFYLSGDRMMAVEISTMGASKAGTPRTLFEGRFLRSSNGVAGYDVAADGRFLMVQPLHPDPPTNQIHVVLNWFEELKRLVPVN